MENTEKSEALAAIDVIAAEIHEEYRKVGETTGHKLPTWEDLPNEARSMSRTLARLTLSKMERVYLEACDKAKKGFDEKLAALPKPAAAPAPAPALPPINIEKTLDAISLKFKDALLTWGETKDGNPLEQGIDNAIRKFAEKLALDVLASSPELMSKLRDSVAEALTNGLLGDKEEE